MIKNNTFCIIGMNTFGESLANQLNDLGCQVIVIDKDQDVVNRLNNHFDRVVQADATNISALKALGVQDIPTVIVCVPDFETSVYVCTNLKDMKIDNIIAYAKSDIQTKILRNIGANNVITPDIHTAKSISLQLSNQFDVQDTFVGNGYSLIKVFVNKFDNGISLQEVYQKMEYIDIFCIKRGNRVILANNVNTIEMGDILHIACEGKRIPSVIQFFYKNPDANI